MKNINFSLLAPAVLGMAAMPASMSAKKQAKADKTRPNVVVILADDMGWGDVSYHGFSDIRTPNIDALAHGGVQFSQGYVSCSISGPSRAGLLSGCNQQRFGFYGNYDKCGIPASQPMIGNIMSDGGYKTGAVGKWHGPYKGEYSPMERFDYFYGFCAGSHNYFDSVKDKDTKQFWRSPIWNDGKPEEKTVQEQGGYLTEMFTGKAVEFIDKNAQDPFFLYVAYNAVHHPWEVPDKYVKRLDDLKVHHPDRRVFAAMALALDDGVGEIMEALRRNGLEENTLVIFLCDNGSPRGQGILIPRGDFHDTSIDYGETIMSSPGGFRGFKGDTYEGGIRIPFLAYWKGVIPAGEVRDLPVSSLDIVPTTLAVTGVEKKGGLPLDGVNIMPYILGEKDGEKALDRTLYWRRDEDFAVRKGDWKLEFNDQGSTRRVQLFNMKDDPYEFTDLSDVYPEKADEMLQIFDQWEAGLPAYGYRPEPATKNLKYNEGVRRKVADMNKGVK